MGKSSPISIKPNEKVQIILKEELLQKLKVKHHVRKSTELNNDYVSVVFAHLINRRRAKTLNLTK